MIGRHGGILYRHVAMRRKEGGQVSRHRGVGGIGQAELLESRAAAGWFIVQADVGEEAVQEHAADFVPSHLRAKAAADQPRSAAGHVDGPLRRPVISQEDLFDPLAIPHQYGPLPRVQLAAGGEAILDVMGQGKIQIVAAEDEVLADRHTMEADLSPFVGGARESA